MRAEESRSEPPVVVKRMRPEVRFPTARAVVVALEMLALPSVVSPVTPSVDEKVPAPPVNVPTVAEFEKRLVLLAVVAKKAVEVAFVAVRFPVMVRSVPSKVRFPESVSWLPVVAYGTLPEVSAVTRRLVVVAVPEMVKPPVAVPSPTVEEAVARMPVKAGVSPVPTPSVVRIAPTEVSSSMERADEVRSVTAAVPLPVKYGSLSAALVNPASAASSAS